MSDYGINFNEFCDCIGCSTEQGREIAGFVMEYLHRAAYCEWDYSRGALASSYELFGGKFACHLMGFLAMTAEGWGGSGRDVVEDVNYNWAQDLKNEMTGHIPDFAEWKKLKTERRTEQDRVRREMGDDPL
ncbi:MAG: hypothetical protein AB7J13_13215 [Pyrinomonadaceae bacterium]|nr:hypothetical protein [Pyrinomonadaceae bacterium]